MLWWTLLAASSNQPDVAHPINAFFLASTAGGRRFCLFHPPVGQLLGLVLYVHPWGEEMNKTRRMASLQARALARAGFGVLQIDLRGCGDSEGDFGDASWQDWVDDVRAGMDWLLRQGEVPIWIWGLRSGCLLAASVTGDASSTCNLVFWQPVPLGNVHLQQFLRLKTASQMIEGGAKGALDLLRKDLAAGNTVCVAGYRLRPELAHGLEQSQLLPPARAGSLVWLEVAGATDAKLPPASISVIEKWQAAGWKTQSLVVNGPPFWRTTEIEDAPGLIDATVAALASSTAGNLT